MRCRPRGACRSSIDSPWCLVSSSHAPTAGRRGCVCVWRRSILRSLVSPTHSPTMSELTDPHGSLHMLRTNCFLSSVSFGSRSHRQQRGATGKLISCSPYFFRKRWAEIMTALQLNDGGFAPYSLRRGGATHDFNVNANFDRSLTRGRWQCVKTCRIYVRQGEEALSRIALTAAQKQCFDLWAAYLREYLQRLQISMG